MKQYLLLFVLLIATGTGFSQTTTNVVSHDEVTIFTDPSKGSNSFRSWAVFPEKGQSVRRITMNVTLAYPDDRPIAHWDYMDRIKILRQGGAAGEVLNYEIGRMLTPYGSNFKETWSYTWKVDVTDFQPFLRDSVEIEYVHSGYEPPELGWDLTIDFDVLFGPPVADFIAMEPLWNGSFPYGDPENPIEESLAPVVINRVGESSFGRLRIQHTGHGMDRPSGCSEFCNRWREVVFDGEVVDHRELWKDCGSNPLYPQGGAWIFDRGYWCPGDLQVPDIIDVPLTEPRHTIDLEMEPFKANDTGQPREQITAWFFQFSGPEQDYDVAVEEVIAPNNRANFVRLNPRGFNPRIRIRNLGRIPLEKLKITWQTVGHKKNVYLWEGNLPFYETAEISLPGEIDSGSGSNIFKVTLSEPNGKKDAWPEDNTLETAFEPVPVIPSRFVVDFLTNNQPEENALFIVNSANDTVYMKSPDILKPATHYSDTVELDPGNYFLQLTDSGGDGLEFWFQPRSGYGRLRLKDVKGHYIHLFESDCGNGQFYGFSCHEHAIVDSTASYLSVNIYPRMVEEHLTIYTTTHKPSTLKVRIMKDGKFIEQHEYTNVQDAETGMDVRHLEEGRYVMEIYLNGEHKMNRRFNKR